MIILLIALVILMALVLKVAFKLGLVVGILATIGAIVIFRFAWGFYVAGLILSSGTLA